MSILRLLSIATKNLPFELLKDGNKCSDCKLETWKDQPIPLQLDHIDGNSDDSSRLNLRLLCPNCHALTPTWGGKNIGKFDSRRSKLLKARYMHVKLNGEVLT